MDNTAESTISETALETAIPENIAPLPVPVDPAMAARDKLASLRADIADQEIALAEAELATAEAAHAALYEQCVEAQQAYDLIDSAVEAQKHLAFQATDRRLRAANTIASHRMNPPGAQQQFGVARKYGDRSNETWNSQLEAFEAEQTAAETEYGEVFGKVMVLQGDRRAAAKVLQDLSWPEGSARARVAEMRDKLAALKPMAAAPDWRTPQMNGTTITFTSDNSVRRDPRTSVAATRGPGDPY